MRLALRLFSGIILLTGLAFLVSGALKVVGVGAFAEALVDQSVIPPSVVPLVARLAGPIEILVGLATIVLALTGRARIAGMLSGVVLVLFACYAMVLVLDPPLRGAPCGCFGSFDDRPADWTLVRVRNLAWGAIVMLSGLTVGRRAGGRAAS
ncbi:MAG: hypothetical protein KDA28_07465 [Phycisphaerales bacterium]|nr:hypothetical protein [Phycisphaerales bacterium]